MEMTEEMMSDTIDDVMTEEGDEEEENLLVSKILDEIGISMGDVIPDAPTGEAVTASATASSAAKKPVASAAMSGGASLPSAPAPGSHATAGGDSAIDDLEARLNNLRK